MCKPTNFSLCLINFSDRPFTSVCHNSGFRFYPAFHSFTRFIFSVNRSQRKLHHGREDYRRNGKLRDRCVHTIFFSMLLLVFVLGFVGEIFVRIKCCSNFRLIIVGTVQKIFFCSRMFACQNVHVYQQTGSGPRWAFNRQPCNLCAK